MNHNLAVKEAATDRYVHGKMSEAERKAFERHMFTCDVCTEEVRNASEFLLGMREVMKSNPSLVAYEGEDRHAAMRLVPAFWRVATFGALGVAVLAIGFGGYQTTVAHKFRSDQTRTAAQSKSNEPAGGKLDAQLIPPHRVRLENEVRGHSEAEGGVSGPGTPAKPVLNGNEPQRVVFDIQHTNSPAYKIILLDPAGEQKKSFEVSAETAENPIEMLFPPGALEPGQYTVVVKESNGQENGEKGEVNRFTFAVR